MEEELSGRQNIELMMVYHNALSLYNSKLEKNIIDFSELKEKIDWPVKTHSSGMRVRLAFSISLFKKSDILLLDEVFSVGDGYFANKSIKSLHYCESSRRNNTRYMYSMRTVRA
jgi:lipopolysaccharide transport system ATP-binding protein